MQSVTSQRSCFWAHVTGKGLLIQIMRPDAVAVKLHIDGRKTAVNMEKVDESGFFAALVSSKKKAFIHLFSGEG